MITILHRWDGVTMIIMMLLMIMMMLTTMMIISKILSSEKAIQDSVTFPRGILPLMDSHFMIMMGKSMMKIMKTMTPCIYGEPL